MPTYEYHCEKCKKNFDMVQSMKDAPLTHCPKNACRRKTWGKGKVKRLMGTGAGLIFKGSGFYITDYRSAGYKEAARKDSAAAGESKGASKPDSGKTATPAPSTTPASSTTDKSKPGKKE